MSLVVERLAVGPFQANCYIVGDSESGEGFVVDPGAEAERILERVAARKLPGVERLQRHLARLPPSVLHGAGT